MASKQVSQVVARLAASIPRNRHGSRPWYDKVDPKHHELLKAILAAWHAGTLGNRRITAARGIVATLADHGITIGEQGVITWLKQSPRS